MPDEKRGLALNFGDVVSELLGSQDVATMGTTEEAKKWVEEKTGDGTLMAIINADSFLGRKEEALDWIENRDTGAFLVLTDRVMREAIKIAIAALVRRGL